jgi:prepilin-type N-terminal cleavage/methylation domain-containing protein
MLSRRDGFTLLELLLVVTVLSAVAWMSLGVVGNNADQVRFEDTRNRLQAIRRAIIGDTSRTINGQPEVRGYVADMGRLPNSLQELVAREYCEGYPEYATEADCKKDGKTWNKTAQPVAYTQDDEDTGIWAGWHGPYLSAGATLSTDGPKFLDGWGNDGDGRRDDFGWNYFQESDGDVLVQSYGRDGTTTGTEMYDAEYPASTQPLIVSSEYRKEIGTVTVVMDFSSAAQCFACSDGTHSTEATCTGTWSAHTDVTSNADCTGTGDVWQPSENVCMAVAYHKDGIFYRGNTEALTPHIAGPQTVTWNGAKNTVTFNFGTDDYLYLGQFAYAIVKASADVDDPCPITQFTATHSFPSETKLWTPFTYVPGTTLQPFERKINSY